MTDEDLIDYDLLKKLKENYTIKLIIKKEKNRRAELKNQFRRWNTNNVFIKIIKEFDKKLLIWLNENDCPFDVYTFSITALFGNLDNMKWLKENNCPWDEYTFHNATRFGNLDNMKWLKENDCPWDEETFSSAAMIRKLENMKWLKENDCPWDEKTFAYSGNFENMKWLLKNNCPLYVNNKIDNAAIHDKIHMFCNTIKFGTLEMMKLLKEINYYWDGHVFNSAINDNGTLEKINWLKENGCPGNY